MVRAACYTALLLTGIYLLFRWDYHVSNIIFETACSDTHRVGVHFYEHPELSGDIRIPVTETADPLNKSQFFHLDEDSMIDMSRFELHYVFVKRRVEEVSGIGPVYRIRSSITRRLDGKLISEMVTVRSQRGWLSNLLTQGHESRECPDYGTSTLRGVPKQTAYHSYLVPLTFSQD